MAATGLGPALDGCPSPACETTGLVPSACPARGEDLHPTRRSSSSVLPANTGPRDHLGAACVSIHVRQDA
jgi:hypothetical protein